MATAAERARAKAARLAAATKPAPLADDMPAGINPADLAAPVAPLPPPDRTSTTETVRTSLDLPAAQHDAFDAWARSTARRYRLGRSIRPDVLRALVRRLLADDFDGQQLRESITDELRRERAR